MLTPAKRHELAKDVDDLRLMAKIPITAENIVATKLGFLFKNFFRASDSDDFDNDPLYLTKEELEERWRG